MCDLCWTEWHWARVLLLTLTVSFYQYSTLIYSSGTNDMQQRTASLNITFEWDSVGYMWSWARLGGLLQVRNWGLMLPSIGHCGLHGAVSRTLWTAWGPEFDIVNSVRP